MNPKLEITEFNWPSRIGINLYDREVSIEIDNRRFIGRKCNSKLEVANKVAFMEAIERGCANDLGLETTSGCAVHEDLILAKQNSANEVIERHILYHLFYHGALCSIEPLDKFLKEIESIHSLHHFCKEHNVVLKVCTYSYFDKYFVAVYAYGVNALKSKFGYILSSCISNDIKNGIIKAVDDLFPSLYHYLNKENGLTEFKIDNRNSTFVDRHVEFVRSIHYSSLVGEELFIPKNQYVPTVENFNFQILKFDEFKWINEISSTLSGYFVKTSSSDAASFFFGNPSDEVAKQLKQCGCSRYNLPLPLA